MEKRGNPAGETEENPARKPARIDFHYESTGMQVGRTKRPKRMVFDYDEDDRAARVGSARRKRESAGAHNAARGGAALRTSAGAFDSGVSRNAAVQGQRTEVRSAPQMGYNAAPPSFHTQAPTYRACAGRRADSAGQEARMAAAPLRDDLGQRRPSGPNASPKNAGCKTKAAAGNRSASGSSKEAFKRKRKAQERAQTRASKARRAPKQISYEQARRRKYVRRAGTALAVTAIVALGIWISMKVLFKVSRIEIEGDSSYTQEQILAAFGGKKGDMLFSFGAATAKKMEQTLPYLETVTIRRSLPSTIHLSVTPAQDTYTLNTAAGWAVLSAGFKVLRIDAQAPEGLVLLQGGEAVDPLPGQALALADGEQQAALTAVCAALTAQQLAPVTQIDLTNTLELSFVFDNRILVKLGTTGDLNNKVEWAKYLMTSEEEQCLSATERGTLDVSTRNENGRIEGIWRAGAF